MRKPRPEATPPHYRTLFLKNFRGFKNAGPIRLAPLTFLVGPNSSGKSSISDALLLLAQSDLRQGRRSPVIVPNWIGPLVDLGSYKDTVYKHNANLKIEIGIEVSPFFVSSRDSDRGFVEQPMMVSYELNTTKDDPIGRVSKIRIADSLTNETVVIRYEPRRVIAEILGAKRSWSAARNDSYLLSWIHRQIEAAVLRQPRRLKGHKAAFRRIAAFFPTGEFLSLIDESQRVSSGRAAPKRWYSIADSRPHRGLDGDESMLFDGVDPTTLEEPRWDPYYSRSRLRRFRAKQKRTLSTVLSDLEIGSQLHDTKLSPYHLGINIRDSSTGITSNLIDVGYGASQVIPVLKACLSTAEGTLFVEQPEIHLHPKAQGTVGDLLCETSRHRQVVVETHSVRMINRARLFIARGYLQPSHVIVNYVDRKHDGSHVYPIPILANGEFGAAWPDGFFDERYEDTMLLLKLKSDKET